MTDIDAKREQEIREMRAAEIATHGELIEYCGSDIEVLLRQIDTLRGDPLHTMLMMQSTARLGAIHRLQERVTFLEEVGRGADREIAELQEQLRVMTEHRDTIQSVFDQSDKENDAIHAIRKHPR